MLTMHFLTYSSTHYVIGPFLKTQQIFLKDQITRQVH